MKKIKLNKTYIFLNLLALFLFMILTLFMVIKPSVFISSRLPNKPMVFILGLMVFISCISLFYSRLYIVFKKDAIFIGFTKEYFIENTTYESIGEIKWKDITKITSKQNNYNRLKYLEIEINNLDKYYKYKNFNLLQKFLIFMKNWDPKKTIILHSRNLNITFEELEELMNENFEKYK